MPLPRESVRDIVALPCEPLTVSFDVCVHEYVGVFPCCVGAYSCLNRVNAGFAEVRLSHPTLGCRAVGHRKCAVSWVEAAVDDVDPRCDDRREELEQIVRRSKEQIVGDLEAPCGAQITVAAEAVGA